VSIHIATVFLADRN